jgi:hypothetical protein
MPGNGLSLLSNFQKDIHLFILNPSLTSSWQTNINVRVSKKRRCKISSLANANYVRVIALGVLFQLTPPRNLASKC